MLSSCKEDGADRERNAIVAPSQQTSQHSRVLTPNSFQGIRSTPRKLLMKASKVVSLNNWATLLKTNIFNVKIHQHGVIRKVPLVLLNERKERTSLQRSLKKTGSVVSVSVKV
jgi:hypothetical protein